MSSDPLLDHIDDYTKLQSDFNSIFSCDKTYKEITDAYHRSFPSLSSLMSALNVHAQSGIDINDVNDIKQRREKFGQYKKGAIHQFTFWQFIKGALNDDLLIDLLEGSVISLLIGVFKDGVSTGWIDSFGVLVSVFIVASITAMFNYQKQKKFIELQKAIDTRTVIVKRNSKLVLIQESELLTGDILKVQKRDIINVNGVILSGHILGYDMKNSTSIDISSDNGNDVICSPLRVEQGEADIIVILPNLKQGEEDEEKEKEHNGVEKEINELSESIGNIGFIMGFVVGFIILFKSLLINYINGYPMFNIELAVIIVDAYIIMEAFKVVAIPEGLPLSGNISIAFAVQKMIDDGVLINHIEKITEIAKMNYIIINNSSVCKGEHQIKQAFIYGSRINEQSKEKVDKIAVDVIANSSSKVITANERPVAKGQSAIDNAMINYVISHSDKLNDTLKNIEMDARIKMKIPFNNVYNYSLAILEEDKEYTAYIKGASEYILKMCTKYYNNDGDEVPIDKTIDDVIKEYTAMNGSVIILAKKTMESPEIKEDFYTNFVISAILAVCDEVQDNVDKAIVKCKDAGIEIKMVTSDSIQNSVKTCEEIKLLSEEEAKSAVNAVMATKAVSQGKFSFRNLMNAKMTTLHKGMNASDFFEHCGGYEKQAVTSLSSSSSKSQYVSYDYHINNKKKFTKMLSSVSLLSASNIDDKAALITGIKKNKENSVGVTFSASYSPSSLLFNLSDVSFSLNTLSNNSDVLLVYHSLSNIISSVKHARNIIDSIRKFVQFQLTICIVTVTFCTLGNFYFIDTPLSPVQMLWINIIMDSLGALALATDAPDDNILKYRPYDGKLFNKMTIVNVVTQVLFQITLLFTALLYGDVILGVPSDKELRHHMWNNVNGYQLTFIFNMFVFMQVFNLMNCRKCHSGEYNIFRGMFKNSIFLFVISLIVGVQMIFVNFGGRVVRTQKLSWRLQGISVGVAAIGIVIGFIAKLCVDDDDVNKGEKKRKKIEFVRVKRGFFKKMIKNDSDDESKNE